jgi:hypothetical protein
MATTTNYGWTTPDDTALVKDGAAAIRTLGSSVDTTTKALNPSTTLGDIEYRSSTANTNTRLGIGTTGQVLAVSGGVPAWSTVSSGGMTLLSTTTLSGASTTISSISQDYKRLIIYVYQVTNNTANGVFYSVPNDDGGLFTGIYLNTTTFGNTNADAAYLTWNGDQGLRTSNNNAWTMEIENYSGTSLNKTIRINGHYLNASSATRGYTLFGTYLTATAISSIKFQNAGGSFSAGTVEIYGVK